MPKIYYDEEGNLIKEGSNGCTDCGLPIDNKEVMPSPEVEDTNKTEEVNEDDY